MNGTVNASSIFIGDIATYSCDDGFRVSETTPRICQDNATWSESEPTCESK